MSNRIAASRMTDRLELAGWQPAASRWYGLRAAALAWLQHAQAPDAVFALSPQLQRDVGLPAAVAGTSALDFEARRLGF
jgi:hypothetical protein